jgi:hypothetical protein
VPAGGDAAVVSRQGWTPARAESDCGFGSRQPGTRHEGGTPSRHARHYGVIAESSRKSTLNGIEKG